jgi:hypothetical protein
MLVVPVRTCRSQPITTIRVPTIITPSRHRLGRRVDDYPVQTESMHVAIAEMFASGREGSNTMHLIRKAPLADALTSKSQGRFSHLFSQPQKRRDAQVEGRPRLGRRAQNYLTASYLPNGYVE